MDLNYASLGDNIRHYRKKRGLTQEKLAELANLGTSHIGKIENAKAVPSFKTVVSIANKLKVGIDQLIHKDLVHKRDYFIMDLVSLAERFDHEDKNFAMYIILRLIETIEEYRQMGREGLK